MKTIKLFGRFDEDQDTFFTPKSVVDDESPTFHLGVPVEEFINIRDAFENGATVTFTKDNTAVKEAEKMFED